MIDKAERRKRLVDDFKKIAEHTGKDVSDAVAFAQNIPDEALDYLEDLGFGSEKIKIESHTETLKTIRGETGLKTAMIFDINQVKLKDRKG